MKKAPEMYNDYLKRMEGFADFKPLTKEQWEAEVAANVGSFGGVKIDPYPAPLQAPKEEPQPTTVMGQFIPAPSGVPEDHTDQCLMCGTPIPPGPDFCSLKCEEKCEEAHKAAPKELQSVSAEEVGKVEDVL